VSFSDQPKSRHILDTSFQDIKVNDASIRKVLLELPAFVGDQHRLRSGDVARFRTTFAS
jgi:hypothetical protein